MFSIEYSIYIVNDIDRPYEKQLAVRRGHGFAYIDPELRKAHKEMAGWNATSLGVFGFEVDEETADAYTFIQKRPSAATYEDGTPRQWSGAAAFTLLKKDISGARA